MLNGVQADRAVLRVLQGKEDEEEAYGVTRVQTSGQNIYAHGNGASVSRAGIFITKRKRKSFFRLTVVLGPPAKVAPTNNVVEHEADENPGHIVERCRGRQVARAREDEREIEVLEELHLELLLECPLDHWRDDADQEEKHETVVELAM